MGADFFGFAAGIFQKLTYPAAITTLIFKNRHTETPVIDKQSMIQLKDQKVKALLMIHTRGVVLFDCLFEFIQKCRLPLKYLVSGGFQIEPRTLVDFRKFLMLA
jgi:hypothetical protein